MKIIKKRGLNKISKGFPPSCHLLNMLKTSIKMAKTTPLNCTDPKKLDNKLLKGFSSVLHRTESF
ncbi:hypothetical protein, partial [Streptococcus lutetiensis]|uniref:hypothetical protein n=1 Tax=Streptococcus lutetiensis TaxID=150055 RepID=UPI001BD9AA82